MWYHATRAGWRFQGHSVGGTWLSGGYSPLRLGTGAQNPNLSLQEEPKMLVGEDRNQGRGVAIIGMSGRFPGAGNVDCLLYTSRCV